jgi:hypothetical protein
MTIATIIDGNVCRTCLAPGIDEDEFISQNPEYFKTDTIIDPSKMYKLDSKGLVIEDIEKTLSNVSIANKNLALRYLSNTDYLLLLDNPANLTPDQIDELTNFRKELRAVDSTFPIVPSFIKSI